MTARDRRLFLLLFVLSGAAGLLYQVVWTRKLLLLFGATTQSVSAVLAAFMAGFGLGGWWGGRRAAKGGDLLKLYGLLELVVAGLAALFPWTLSAVQPFLESVAPGMSPGALLALKVAIVFALVLPSTTAMGATFPLLVQAWSGQPGQRVGLLFTANTFGACAGVLVTGFLLVGALGLSGTQALGVVLNLAVGFAALKLAQGMAAAPAQKPGPTVRAGWLPLACYFVAGVTGMASEVVWSRVLIPSFNNSVYGVSTVLAVYLAGLSLGSWAAAKLEARTKSPLDGLGAALTSAGVLGFIGLYVFELSQLVQMTYADTYAMGVRPLIAWPLAEAALVLLPVATLQGMVLPLAVQAAAPDEDSVGKLVGGLYAVNTAGALIGSLAAGFWLIPAFSVQKALMVVVGLQGLLGAVVLWRSSGPVRRAAPALAALTLVLVARGWTGRNVQTSVLVDWISANAGEVTILRYSEDAEASVAVVQRDMSRFLVINGVGVAGYSNATKTLAHLPLMAHPDPKKVLVICFGVGTTWRSANAHPGVEVHAVDLVPSVFASFREFYAGPMPTGANRWIVGDGRGHLQLSGQTYDAVMVDPSPPLYAAGTVNLYNEDFFRLALSRLNKDGILAVWVPEYPESEFLMIVKSFLTSVPHVQVWHGSDSNRGAILLGSATPLTLDKKRILAKLKSEGIRKDYLEFNKEFEKPEKFFSLHLGGKERFLPELAAVPVITDDEPWIEYPWFRSKTKDYFRAPRMMKKEPVPVPFVDGSSGLGPRATVEAKPRPS